MLGTTFVKSIAIAAVAATALTAATPKKAEAGADPYLGEVMIYPYTFCPRGWTEANGQLLSVSQYTALFSLYGTNFGGDGRTTFGLPDLRGRVPMHLGTGPGLSPRTIGQKFGTETETMTVNQMPSHSHTVNSVSGQGDKGGPNSDFLSAPGANDGSLKYNDLKMYHDGPATATMDPGMIASTGGNQPQNNIQPVQVLRYCVALEGLFPPRN